MSSQSPKIPPVPDADDVRAVHGDATKESAGFVQGLLPDFALKLRQISEASSNLLIITDPQLRIAFASHGYGPHSARALEGMQLIDLLPTDARAAATLCASEVLAGGAPERFTMEQFVTAAMTRYYDVRVSPIWQDGRVSALTVNFTETTEQMLAQRAISMQARMIESMLEGVALITKVGVIEITNPAFDALFGHERGQLIGAEVGSLLAASEDLNGWRTVLTQVARNTRSASLDMHARQRNGDLFDVFGVLSRFEIAGREYLLLVMQDVSKQRALERALIEAVNREQYRIGNDLHDGLGQELTGIALMLRSVAGRMAAEYPSVVPDMEEISRLLSNAVESTRALARGLSPVNLERGGLSDALDGLAAHARDLYGIEVACTQQRRGGMTLDPETANHLYRIAQEAITNAVRHGKATRVSVHLSSMPRRVRLAISDDGTGIAADASSGPGMGLKIMQYRARIARGELKIERLEPRGTRVLCECSVPSRTKRAAGKRVANA